MTHQKLYGVDIRLHATRYITAIDEIDAVDQAVADVDAMHDRLDDALDYRGWELRGWDVDNVERAE